MKPFLRPVQRAIAIAILIASPYASEGAQAKELWITSDQEVGELLVRVEDRLPLRLKERLLSGASEPIHVILNRKLPAPGSVLSLCAVPAPGKKAPKVVLGRVHPWFPHRIELNAWLVREYLDNPGQLTSCAHRTIRELTEATLIHEVAHLYDLAAGEEGQRVSDESSFQKRIWTGGFPARTPDVYELKNASENFAVNLELFLLDPSFKCRRPTLYRYFESLFNEAPFESNACQADTEVFLHSQNVGKNLIRKMDLDPNRIYQVHFLFASRGSALMSRWGHAMYRLVVCAPDREKVGPDCLRDVQYHVVVSHRAAVEDLSVSYWGGLWGKYPSQPFLYALTEIIDEYTKLEKRDMISLPLNISEEAKRSLVERILEQYWGYRGQYFFLTNNCADEALKLLQGAEDSPELEALRTMSPLGLYKKYARIGMIDPKLVEHKDEAEAAGLFFRSKGPAFIRALETLRKSDSTIKQTLVQDWYHATTAESRRDRYRTIVGRADRVTQKSPALPGSFYVLESYALLEGQRDLSRAVSNELERLQKKGDPRGTLYANAFASGMSIKDLPALQGYGIPLTSEFGAPLLSEEERVRMVALASEITDWVTETFGSKMLELRGIAENMKFFRLELLNSR